jgi:hypothetical protein
MLGRPPANSGIVAKTAVKGNKEHTDCVDRDQPMTQRVVEDKSLRGRNLVGQTKSFHFTTGLSEARWG